MLVSELEGVLSRRREVSVEVSVADIEIDSGADHVTVKDVAYPLDEIAEKTLAKYFDIPLTYLKGCPTTFKAHTLQFWRDEYADHDVVVQTIGNNIVNVHSPEVLNLPAHELGKLIARVFEPEDRVRIYRPLGQLQFDVVSQRHQVEVPNPERVKFRPEVGDVTHGGVRLLTHVHSDKQPSLVPYIERYVCTNGMCVAEKMGRIAIKGNTVEEILAEIEAAANRAMMGIDDALGRYAGTARQEVPGTRQAFAHQLGMEMSLPQGVMDEVMILVNQLPDNATVYDVNQAFTSVANLDVTHAAKVKLQTLGGHLAFEPDKMIARCRTCEQRLRS
jgi:hypothetical protein